MSEQQAQPDLTIFGIPVVEVELPDSDRDAAARYAFFKGIERRDSGIIPAVFESGGR